MAIGKNVQKNEQLLDEFQNASKDNTVSRFTPKVSEADGYYNPGKELSKVEKKIEKIETTMKECEEYIDSLKMELINPEISSDYIRLDEIQKEMEAKEMELLDLMTEWDELSSLKTDIQQEINERAK